MQDSRKYKKWVYAALHVTVWGLLFLFPLLILPQEEHMMLVLVRKSWLALAFSILLFYLNHFWLVERLFLRKKYAAYILLNIVLMVLMLAGIEYIKAFIYNPHASMPYRVEYSLYKNSITMVLSVVSSVALGALQRWRAIERHRQQEENEKLQSELAHLHYQLQPHFFFNSLNNIYSLIDTRPDTAKDLVHSLSGLMRYMLYEAREPRVPLAHEIKFLKLFIVQMSTRVHERVKVTAAFPENENGMEIAPLLFIPLVENTFKHGINPSGDCAIEIEMKLDGRILYFRTRNEVFDLTHTEEYRHGIGLNNLKRRLELLYAGKYAFRAGIEGKYYITDLEIHL